MAIQASVGSLRWERDPGMWSDVGLGTALATLLGFIALASKEELAFHAYPLRCVVAKTLDASIRETCPSGCPHGRRLPSAMNVRIFAQANMPVAVKATPVDLMFRAFSDRTRLRILSMLRPGELCVCDIVAVLDVPQPKVSRHLAYLRKAGLVDVRRDGQWMHYTLTPARGQFHTKLLDCLSCCLQDVPELARDAKRVKSCRSGGDCC